MVEKTISVVEAAEILGVSRQAVYQMFEKGVLAKVGKPARVKWGGVTALCRDRGIPFPADLGEEKAKKASRKAFRNGKTRLLDIDVSKVDLEELGVLKRRLDAEKVAEDIRKKRKEAGELVERHRVAMFFERFCSAIMDSYWEIADGFDSEVVGQDPAQIRGLLEKRLDKYGQGLKHLIDGIDY